MGSCEAQLHLEPLFPSLRVVMQDETSTNSGRGSVAIRLKMDEPATIFCVFCNVNSRGQMVSGITLFKLWSGDAEGVPLEISGGQGGFTV